jgi:hypothetical protein
MRPRRKKFAEGRTPNPAEYAQMWPTPRANSGKGAAIHGQEGMDLQTAVKLCPTPDTKGFTNKGAIKMLAGMTVNHAEFSGMAYRAGKKKTEYWPTPTSSMMTIQDMEQARFSGSDPRRQKYQEAIPTPTANDAKNSLTESQRGRRTLTARLVETESEISGQLNPAWVEWLMGYPLGWTDLNVSVTPLSLKFPS